MKKKQDAIKGLILIVIVFIIGVITGYKICERDDQHNAGDYYGTTPWEVLFD